MVVDDQDLGGHRLLAHLSGTSAAIVVPAPSCDSTVSRPSISASRSFIPRSRQTAAVARALETLPVVLDQHGHGSLSLGKHDADSASLRVLDDVRQGLLCDAVERGLDFLGESLWPELLDEIDLDPGLLAEVLDQALEGRDEAKVVEGFRPELNREAPNILQRGHD